MSDPFDQVVGSGRGHREREPEVGDQCWSVYVELHEYRRDTHIDTVDDFFVPERFPREQEKRAYAEGLAAGQREIAHRTVRPGTRLEVQVVLEAQTYWNEEWHYDDDYLGESKGL